MPFVGPRWDFVFFGGLTESLLGRTDFVGAVVDVLSFFSLPRAPKTFFQPAFLLSRVSWATDDLALGLACARLRGSMGIPPGPGGAGDIPFSMR